jgi:hypothetical protein
MHPCIECGEPILNLGSVGVNRLLAVSVNELTAFDLAMQMAEGTGFEPAIRVNVCLFSRLSGRLIVVSNNI